MCRGGEPVPIASDVVRIEELPADRVESQVNGSTLIEDEVRVFRCSVTSNKSLWRQVQRSSHAARLRRRWPGSGGKTAVFCYGLRAA